MNTHKISLLARFFLTAAKAEKLPPKSNDLDTILKNISELETYKARVDYAEANMEHMSSGSSRVIYKMGDKVVKLTKNDRGVAQNKAEANPKMKSKYITPTLKADKDGAWRVSKFLEKITEKEFEKLTGLDFKDFGEVLSYEASKDEDSDPKPKVKDYDKILKSDIVKDLLRLSKDFELLPGDMVRISSWGVMDDVPVLLDAGLTRDIYDKYYSSTEKKSDSSKSKSKSKS